MTLIKPGYSLTVLQEAGVTAIEGSGADFAKAVGYSGNRAIVVRSVPMGDGTQPVTFRAEVLSDSLIQTTLVAEGPGRLTLRDRNMPGWTATVDGQPAEIKGTRWRELELPEGEHTVVFKYTPSGLRLGLILFGISAIVTVAGLLFHRFKKPR
jgi:hypothetical protein